MAEAQDVRRKWLERVLGFTFPAAPPTSESGPADILARWRAARDGWQSAVERVNSQIDALAKALRATGDTDLAEIADTGLMTVTGGFRTKMTAAMHELGTDDAAKLRKNGGKAAGFAEKLKAQLDSDAKVAGCDANPYGVAVSIRATLGPALANLAAVLRAAARA